MSGVVLKDFPCVPVSRVGTCHSPSRAGAGDWLVARGRGTALGCCSADPFWLRLKIASVFPQWPPGLSWLGGNKNMEVACLMVCEHPLPSPF